MDGTIFDIKRFAVHDGPGIRTTVFLKGCPLNCIWCHNPEGIAPNINLWYFENKCIKCHHCIHSCQNHALSIQEKPDKHIGINHLKCSKAGTCVLVCPTGALSFDGKQITSDEVVKALLDDKLFYEQSAGGITLSGGDPLFQPDFSLEILKACKSLGIHTAIETSLYTRVEILEKFLTTVDLFITDLKIFDTTMHEKYTGVPNELIKSNIRFLADHKANMLIRIPLIPGITALDNNIKEIASFIYQLRPDISIELMNYNMLTESKYRIMNKPFDHLQDMKKFSKEELDYFMEIIKKEGSEF